MNGVDKLRSTGWTVPPPRAAQFVDGEPQARGWLGVLFCANATFNHMQILRLLSGKHPNRQHLWADRAAGFLTPQSAR